MEEIKGELTIMDTLGIKPNYSELSRKYGIDRRTIQRYHLGYEGKPKNKNKPSKLDKYLEEITQKINLNGATIKGTYKYFQKKYSEIGSYSNFKTYIQKHHLKVVRDKKAHPRYETEMGKQLQFDWKENIKMISKYGELYEFNIFSATLSWSRLHVFVYSINKTRADVERCLIHVFKYIGGIPQELLTDNMISVVDLISKDGKTVKKINPKFNQFVKDMGTTIKTCKTRSPETKGKVESPNRFATWLIPYNHEFENEKELINIVNVQLTKDVNNEKHADLNIEPIILFNKEKSSLQPLPNVSIMDSYTSNSKKIKVTSECLIRVNGKAYSVDPQYINCYVDIEEHENKLYIYYQDSLIETYDLCKYNQKINYKPEHYSKALSQSFGKNIKPEDIENKALENLKNLDMLGGIVNDLQ